MINVRRKATNAVTSKALATATEAQYTISLNDIRRMYADLLIPEDTRLPRSVSKVIDEEVRWCSYWLNELTNASKNDIVLVTPNIILEKNSNIEYLESDEISIDLFNERFINRTNLKDEELRMTTKIVASGISNNFRFYNRPDCRIIVLDYRKLTDCLAFFYGYRELGITIAYIEDILENCSSAVINQSTDLESLIRHTLGTYKSQTNILDGLLQKEPNSNCRDGDMFELISKLRISSNCFQIIQSTHQIETWQHHKLPLTANANYSQVLTQSRSELFAELIKGMINEICENKELTDTKIICAGYGCIALSIPNLASEQTIKNVLSAQIRLFSRQFCIKPRLYTYNPMTSYFVEEE